MRKVIVGLVLAASLAAAGRAEAEDKLKISHQMWGWYQEYLQVIGNGRKPGAFAVTVDGSGAYYVTCPETRCEGGITYSQDAVNKCEREYGTECVVFAVRDDIRAEYEIIEQ